nr:hypothetical protein [Tanacetum cinerariifolium]
MDQNFYEPNMCSNSISFDFDQSQPPQFPVIHQPPQEMSIQEMEDLKQQYLDEMKRLTNSEYHDEIKIDELKGNLNNEFIKSSVENLIPNPSESEGIPDNMSDFYEFADELTHIISPPEYDCFFFKIEPNLGDFTIDMVEDTFPTREPRVHNALPTHPTLQLNLEFKLSSESLFTYVVWIFLPFLLYSVDS